MSLSITNKTKGSVPKIQYELIKDEVVGKGYNLSLVFCSTRLSQRLNTTYRDKNKPTNVLSFPLDNDSGEIFINLTTAKKEVKKFDMKFTKFVTYLFIHGLLHLKGMEHGDTMERAEKKLLNGATNSSWY
ncbi:MAG: rRNA maturation RNase YbeY [Parcubacteria group bacterium]